MYGRNKKKYSRKVGDELRLVGLLGDLHTLRYKSSSGTVPAVSYSRNLFYEGPQADLAVEGGVGGGIVTRPSNSSEKHDLK